jgi:hypothetical protein
VSLRDRIVRLLGGEAPVDHPDVVEVATIELWRSELVASALREAGVPCEVVPTGGPAGNSQYATPQARIMVAGDRAAEARRIVDEVTRR